MKLPESTMLEKEQSWDWNPDCYLHHALIDLAFMGCHLLVPRKHPSEGAKGLSSNGVCLYLAIFFLKVGHDKMGKRTQRQSFSEMVVGVAGEEALYSPETGLSLLLSMRPWALTFTSASQFHLPLREARRANGGES